MIRKMPLRLRAAALLLLVGVGGIDSKLQRWYRDNTAVWTPPGEIAVIAKVAESAPIETPGPSSPFVNWHLELARRDNPPDDPSPTLSDPVSPGQTCGTVRAHGRKPRIPAFRGDKKPDAFVILSLACPMPAIPGMHGNIRVFHRPGWLLRPVRRWLRWYSFLRGLHRRH